MYPAMVHGIGTDNPCRFNKGRSSKFRVGSRVRQTPEESRRTYQPKRCGNNNKDEDNSPKTLNDKNRKVPQSWIIACLKMYKMSDEAINLSRIPLKTGELNWQQEEKPLLKWKYGEESSKEMCYHHYYL